MLPADQLCSHCRQACIVPLGALQHKSGPPAVNRRALNRHPQRQSRKPASAAVARSTFDRAQLDDDTAVLDTLQKSFGDSPHQDDEQHNGNTDTHVSSKYTAVLKGSKQHRHPVQEKQRPLGRAEGELHSPQCLIETHNNLRCSGVYETTSQSILGVGCKED